MCVSIAHTLHTLSLLPHSNIVSEIDMYVPCHKESLACLSWHRVDLIAIDISSSYIPDTYYYIRVLSKHSFLIIYMTGDWSQVIVFDFPAKNIPFQFSLIPSNAVLYSYRTYINLSHHSLHPPASKQRMKRGSARGSANAMPYMLSMPHKSEHREKSSCLLLLLHLVLFFRSP